MEVRNVNKKKPSGFQPPFRGSQSPEPSSQAGALGVLGRVAQSKDDAMNSERESCSVSRSSPSGVFELAAAYTKANSGDSAQGANTVTQPHLTKSPPNKTTDGRVSGYHSKCPIGSKKGSTKSAGQATTASKLKRLTTTLHARVLKCPAKLLTHKLAVSRLHKDCTVSVPTPQKKPTGMCTVIEEKSLGDTEYAGVPELSVYELPPTQSEVRFEQQAKTSGSKRKRVLTQEQRLVRKEVMVIFERLHAEIEQIREKYGHVLNKNVYSKRASSPFLPLTDTATKEADELWFECNEE